MNTPVSPLVLHPPISGSPLAGRLRRAWKSVTHPLSRVADILDPIRVCHRTGHVPGHDVFAYKAWDLDLRYPGKYVGHACGRCGQVVA